MVLVRDIGWEIEGWWYWFAINVLLKVKEHLARWAEVGLACYLVDDACKRQACNNSMCAKLHICQQTNLEMVNHRIDKVVINPLDTK